MDATRDLDVRQPSPVAREAEVLAVGGWRRDGRDGATKVARALVDRYPPQIHRATAFAREIQMTAIGCPHRVPVERLVIGHRLGIAAARGDRPDVSLPA